MNYLDSCIILVPQKYKEDALHQIPMEAAVQDTRRPLNRGTIKAPKMRVCDNPLIMAIK